MAIHIAVKIGKQGFPVLYDRISGEEVENVSDLTVSVSASQYLVTEIRASFIDVPLKDQKLENTNKTSIMHVL